MSSSLATTLVLHLLAATSLLNAITIFQDAGSSSKPPASLESGVLATESEKGELAAEKFEVVVSAEGPALLQKTEKRSCSSRPRAELGSTTDPLKILFVGNSYTYYNNLIHILMELRLHEEDPTSSGTRGTIKRYCAPIPKLRTLVLTESGCSLGAESHASDFAQVLPAFDPDVVVLQDQSVVPTGGDEKAATKQRLQNEYLPAVRAWALGTNAVKKRSLLFFCTHARPQSMFLTPESRAQHGLGGEAAAQIESELDMLKKLEQGYDEYREIFSTVKLPNFQASVVPVGRTVVAVRNALAQGGPRWWWPLGTRPLGGGAPGGPGPHLEKPKNGLSNSLFVWDESAHLSPCGTLVTAMALFRGIMNSTGRLVDAEGISLRADASCLVGLSTGAGEAVGDKAAFLRVVMEKVKEVGCERERRERSVVRDKNLVGGKGDAKM